MDDFQYLKLISFTLIKIKITDQKSSSANKVAFYPGTLVRVGSPNIYSRQFVGHSFYWWALVITFLDAVRRYTAMLCLLPTADDPVANNKIA